MIYDFPAEHEPIRQGDIFYPLPIPLLELGNLTIVSPEGDMQIAEWDNLEEEDVQVRVPLEKAYGIVASQDCDTSRAPYVTFFEIGTFQDVSGLTLPPQERINKWVKIITQESRKNAKWFYLPIDQRIGFCERMAVNFENVFHIQLSDLEQNIGRLRKGRLNKIAYEHYRESIAQYFRRYPYDEWYPLNKNEFVKYKEEYSDSEPMPWQSD